MRGEEGRGDWEEEGRSLNISTLPTVIERCIRTSPVAFYNEIDNARDRETCLSPQTSIHV